MKVRLADDREFDAEVIGTDPQTDLALIKIDAERPARARRSATATQVRVGEDVIAVGNPFGLGGTVTRGIVSAMARDINAGPYVDFIQTDAAINRGNSGGPLLNLEGEVIGVNSAIYSPNGGSVGVGFAIPSNTVKTVVAQLRDDGAVERGWLGVTIQNVTPEIAAAIGLDDPHGALVADVVDGRPLGRQARDRRRDPLLRRQARSSSSRELPKLVAAAAPDADVKVEVLRQGERRDRRRSSSAASTTERTAALEPGGQRRGRPRLRPARRHPRADHPGRARAARAGRRASSGVVITSLDGNGLAADAGLEVGDVILQVGDSRGRRPRATSTRRCTPPRPTRC